MSERRTRPLRDAALALSTLTVLPLRVRWPEHGRTDAPGYYPLVGALIGTIGFAAALGAQALGWSGRAPLLIAAGLVALSALLTRMLHWDGLGDVADGLSTSDPTRRIEIMGDSHIGAFGVTAIALAVVAQTAAVAPLLNDGRVWALAAVPVYGRLAATFAAWFGRPLRREGLAASVMGRPRLGAIVPVFVVLTALSALNVIAWSVPGVVLSVGGILVALVMPHVVASLVGGVNGDVMGASVVVVETILFAVLAVIL